MRFLALGVLAGSLAAGGCNRAPAPPASDSARQAAVPATGTAADASLRDVTIPAGTLLPVVLDTAVGSDTSRVEEPVQAHLAHAVAVDGVTVLPEGSRITGVVTDATESGRVKGRAHLGLRFDSVAPAEQGERYEILTAPVERTAPGTKKDDALKIGAPAAGGAIIGALIGGKKGALVGTAAGGGAGTAVVLSTRGKEVRLGGGAVLTLKLTAPVTVRVRG